jgi:hypothetical protein
MHRRVYTLPAQTSQAAKNVIASDGLIGLFGRGLKTKLIANGMQGLMFSVFWKAIEEKINGPARR